ncbi:hypothetical protein [Mesorhizobium sp. BHbdii]
MTNVDRSFEIPVTVRIGATLPRACGPPLKNVVGIDLRADSARRRPEPIGELQGKSKAESIWR